VGEDGKTHQGPFDISYLRCIPNMVVASPADEDELQHLLYSATCYRRPVAIRYPRGSGRGVKLMPELHELPIGKGEVIRDGRDLTILSLGPLAHNAIEAAEMLAEEGLDCTVISARFAKPLDSELILTEIEKSRNLLTVEESSLCGGFGSAVMELLCRENLSNVKIRCLGLPDSFIEHGPQELFRSLFNIDSEGIAQTTRTSFPELFSKSPIEMQEKR
jgi:1-deoxy-D-xylulose-5-phosphate synthase